MKSRRSCIPMDPYTPRRTAARRAWMSRGVLTSHAERRCWGRSGLCDPAEGGRSDVREPVIALIVATDPQTWAAVTLGSSTGEMNAMKLNNLASSIRLGLALLIFGAFALWLLPSRVSATSPRNVDWPNHGNDLHNTRFQDVDQINKSNVRNLRPAGVVHTKVLYPLSE